MKKTYFKIILSEIKQSFGRFIAIFGIVALGIGFLAGLLSATPDMQASVDTYYDKSNMADIFIKSTMGLTTSDINNVKALPEVEQAMPVYVTDALMKTSGNESLTTRIYGLPLSTMDSGNSFVNRLQLVEGRMPQTKNECLVEQSGNYLSEIALGTTLTVSDENADYSNIDKIYSTKEYTVVGVVSNAFYFSLEKETTNIGNGHLGAIIYVDESCYSLDVYTDLYITVSGAAAQATFSDEYRATIDAVVNKLETLATAQSEIRYNEIVADATEQLNQAKAEYAAGKQEAQSKLAEALQKLNDGKAEIQAGEKNLANAQKTLSDGEARLALEQSEYQKQISSQETALADAQTQIDATKETLAAAKASLDASKADIDVAKALMESGVMLPEDTLQQIAQYDAALTAYEDGMNQITAKEAELAAGLVALNNGKAEAETKFSSVEAELAQARNKIAAGKAALEKAKQDLADGVEKYNTSKAEAENELADAEKKIADAEKQISELQMPKWYVLDRGSNVSYESFYQNSKKVAAIATAFPIFFILVAALIALTTMTRMVEEERTQIGTLKSLGYSKGVIMYKYLAYCGTASLLGSIIGLMAGFAFLPGLIWNAYAFGYHLPPFISQFSISFALIATAVAILCTSAATISACYQALKEKPAALILPRTPKAGKRIFLERIHFIWSKMTFSHKATARNLIRNKKHFFLTVIGIAGCTALILVGFGLRDSVGSIANKQFTNILQYDLIIEKENATASASLERFLNDPAQVKSYLEVSSETGHAEHNGKNVEMSVYVPQDPAIFNEYVHLNERTSGKAINLDPASVVVTEKLADALGIHPGDTFSLENSDGKTADFVLTDITENYVGSYIYMSPAEYDRAFGQVQPNNILLVKTDITGEASQNEALTEIMASGDVTRAEFTSQSQKSYDDLLSTMNFVVIMLIAAAGALAIIVLYNLTNININERRKELATLRVLGFHNKEVGRYIFRETAILTVIGTLTGLALGVLLHHFVITIAEDTNMMFGRQLSVMSFILSAAATFLFSSIVNLLMYRRLKKIEMVESMKTVD